MKRSDNGNTDKGDNYFDIVRSLSSDPELKKAADQTQEKLGRKDGRK